MCAMHPLRNVAEKHFDVVFLSFFGSHTIVPTLKWFVDRWMPREHHLFHVPELDVLLKYIWTSTNIWCQFAWLNSNRGCKSNADTITWKEASLFCWTLKQKKTVCNRILKLNFYDFSMTWPYTIIPDTVNLYLVKKNLQTVTAWLHIWHKMIELCHIEWISFHLESIWCFR